ncbi:hypothetical protein LOD99_8486 [Oopsacas minuta]|uniref:Uncharacterized protein n=1 Tax=Oopsacas minuta TaxID=111878 RepID=A0AAV7JH36_9METZ|nr:hypothetical protein LOD99_8486 [Oopsacas minuta]
MKLLSTNKEALWRLFSFPIHERYPTVVHLSVHLENGQRVYFTQDSVHRQLEAQANLPLLHSSNFAGKMTLPNPYSMSMFPSTTHGAIALKGSHDVPKEQK